MGLQTEIRKRADCFEGMGLRAARQGTKFLCLSQTLCTKATMQTVRAADTNEVVKLIFRESDNDRKVRPCPSGWVAHGSHHGHPRAGSLGLGLSPALPHLC